MSSLIAYKAKIKKQNSKILKQRNNPSKKKTNKRKNAPPESKTNSKLIQNKTKILRQALDN